MTEHCIIEGLILSNTLKVILEMIELRAFYYNKDENIHRSEAQQKDRQTNMENPGFFDIRKQNIIPKSEEKKLCCK